jgi:Tol biopolymer transport system component
MNRAARLLSAVIALFGSCIGVSVAQAALPGVNGEIAFLCYSNERVLNACAISPAGGTSRSVGNLAGGFSSAPRWSPDGRRVLYQSEDPGFGIINAPGLRSVPGTEGYGQPAWSPRGDRIVVVRSPDSRRPKGIYTLGLNGRNLQLVVANGVQPDWSPDGRTLAYQAGRDVWLYDFRTRRSRRLTRSPAGSSSGFPSWAPNGRSIAFSRRSGSGANTGENVFTIAVNGTRQRQLTHNTATGTIAGDSDPSWSPDGRSIAFVHAPDNQTGYFLAVIGADGSNQRNLVGPPTFDALAPDWGRRRR